MTTPDEIAKDIDRMMGWNAPHQRDYAWLRHPEAPKSGLFLDVGANVGQSIASLRLFSDMPAYSIEPVLECRPYLAEWARRRLLAGYRMAAAGSAPGTMQLAVPVVGGRVLTTRSTAYAQKFADRHVGDALRALVNDPGAAITFDERVVTVITIDQLGLAPSVLKIDVEGHEYPVLQGARLTIRAHRPAILLEPTRDFEAIAAWIRSEDYAGYVWTGERLTAWDGSRVENVWLLPA